MTAEPPSPQQLQDLAERIRAGDAAAEEQVLAFFDGRVRLMLLARTRDRDLARDLTQEVLLAVLEALRAGRVRETARLGAFVHGTARNVLSGYFRARQQSAGTVPIEEAHAAADPIAELEEASRRRLVQRALGELAEVDRQILSLTLVDGLKSGEVAERLGLGGERVRTRKSRAVKQLVERLREVSRT